MEQIVAKIGSFALANFGVLAFFGWGLNIEVVKVRLNIN
jgi:hypothetical protein